MPWPCGFRPAGTERPDEGLGELFISRDGMVFRAGVGSDDQYMSFIR